MPKPDELEVGSVGPSNAPWFGISLIGVGSFFLIFAMQIEQLQFMAENDPGPRAFPIILSLTLMLGGCLDILQGWRRSRAAASVALLTNDSENLGASATPLRPAWDVWLLLAALIVYFVAVPWLGFYLCTFLLTALIMTRLQARWWVSLLAAALLLVVIQLLFVRLFKVQLPEAELQWWTVNLSWASEISASVFRAGTA